MIFDYPTDPHERQHGPTGYKAYQAFKIWLRDEFKFRCVFCLIREKWYPNGYAAFSVEHLKPQHIDKRGILDYENLYYACLTCNSVKRAVWPIADPCIDAYSKHLRVHNDGTVEALTREGQILRHTLKLNEQRRVEFRRRMLNTFSALQSRILDSGVRELFQSHFGFPDELPDLRRTRVPSNRRPNGVNNCWFVLRETGRLPEIY
jgi:hypothetical protein